MRATPGDGRVNKEYDIHSSPKPSDKRCPLLLLFNFHEGFYSNNHGSDHPFHGSLTDGILRENNIPDKHHVDLWYSKRA